MLGQSERGRCVAEPCAASGPSAPRAKGGSGLAAASLPLLPRWEGPGHRPPPGSAAFRSVLESVGKAAVSHAQLQRRAGSAGPRPCGRATMCREQPPMGRRAPLPLLFLPSISSKELTELIERLQKNADQVEKNIVETDSRMQNVSTSHGPTPNGSSKHADPLGGGRRDPKFPPAPQPPRPALQPSSMGGGTPCLAPTPQRAGCCCCPLCDRFSPLSACPGLAQAQGLPASSVQGAHGSEAHRVGQAALRAGWGRGHRQAHEAPPGGHDHRRVSTGGGTALSGDSERQQPPRTPCGRPWAPIELGPLFSSCR